MSDKERRNDVDTSLKDSVDTTQLLIVGNCLEALKNYELVPKESIRLTVTSPPYGLGKEYGSMYSDKFNLESWVQMIKKVSKLIYQVTAPNGSFFLNVSPIPNDKTKEIVPLDAYAFFAVKEAGFFLRNKIVWHFNNMVNPVKRLAGRWETILWFVKDINNYVFNLDDVRIPYITVGDKRVKGPGRNPTDVWFYNPETNPTNPEDDLWYFNRVNNMTKNKCKIDFPAVYPEPMIERILRMSSNKGDWILDPFLGSGTTMKVAKNLLRNSVGIEINTKNVEIIKSRVQPESSTILGRTDFKIVTL